MSYMEFRGVYPGRYKWRRPLSAGAQQGVLDTGYGIGMVLGTGHYAWSKRKKWDGFMAFFLHYAASAAGGYGKGSWSCCMNRWFMGSWVCQFGWHGGQPGDC